MPLFKKNVSIVCTTELGEGTEKPPSRPKQHQRNRNQRLPPSGSIARRLPGRIPAAAAVRPSAALRQRQNVDDVNIVDAFVHILDDNEESVVIMQPLNVKCEKIIEILLENGRFPYEMLRDLESFLEEKLARVAAAVEHEVWLAVVHHLQRIQDAYGGRQLVSFEENIHT